MEVSPYGRAPPKTMGHNVLEGYIVVKSKGAPRPPEGVEAMAHRGDVQARKNILEGIPNMGIDNG